MHKLVSLLMFTCVLLSSEHVVFMCHDEMSVLATSLPTLLPTTHTSEGTYIWNCNKSFHPHDAWISRGERPFLLRVQLWCLAHGGALSWWTQLFQLNSVTRGGWLYFRYLVLFWVNSCPVHCILYTCFSSMFLVQKRSFQPDPCWLSSVTVLFRLIF